MTMAVEVDFEEPAAAAAAVAQLPMSHLSVEVGHLYAEDFARGPDFLQRTARQVAPWVHAARQSFVERVGGRNAPRISTCFLIDDYFEQFEDPASVIPMIKKAYAAAGLPIDYLAREAACATAGDITVAQDVLGALVEDPVPGSDGTRPTVLESGWLANGVRTPSYAQGAMSLPRGEAPYAFPIQNTAHRHSVFVDVQLRELTDGNSRWSCPFLAAVWQLLRLGLLRHQGAPVVEAVPYDEAALPDSWDHCPPLIQLNPDKPQPFAAYATFSALSGQFLGIEHAVQTILGQVVVDPEVQKLVTDRISREGLDLPTDKVIDRVEYAFLGSIG